MRFNRLPQNTILSLGFVFAAGACVPKVQSTESTGPIGNRPAVGGVATCQCGDEELTASPPATPAKMACTNVAPSCFPFVRPYTTAEADWDYAKANELMRGMNNSQ